MLGKLRLRLITSRGPPQRLEQKENGFFTLFFFTSPAQALKALINGVRAAGNWKQYCRRDHKQILRLRSLIARGRARERLATSRAMKFIVRQGDNGIVWTILSFWQATN